jgi:hypothetical protein
MLFLHHRNYPSAKIAMKTNPKSSRMFLNLLTHRERHRARPGLLTGWIGRLASLPANQRLEIWRTPLTCNRSVRRTDGHPG